MARGNVYTAPKAYIKIDNEVAGYVRNLNFSEMYSVRMFRG